MAKRRPHYINNADFTKKIVRWVQTDDIRGMKIISKEIFNIKQDKGRKAELLKIDPMFIKKLEARRDEAYKQAVANMPNDVAESFMKLVNHIGSRPNFMGYTYLEDMKGDALFLCVKYAHNFDPTKSNNAFAYFSQVVFNAFKQFLNKEKKYADYKFEQVKESMTNAEKLNWNNIVKSNRDKDGEYIDHTSNTDQIKI